MLLQSMAGLLLNYMYDGPVKDHRTYDWAGCLHKGKGCKGDVMSKAPPWQLRGIRA